MPHYPRKNRNAILHASSLVQWFVSSVQLIAILTFSIRPSQLIVSMRWPECHHRRLGCEVLRFTLRDRSPRRSGSTSRPTACIQKLCACCRVHVKLIDANDLEPLRHMARSHGNVGPIRKLHLHIGITRLHHGFRGCEDYGIALTYRAIESIENYYE